LHEAGIPHTVLGAEEDEAGDETAPGEAAPGEAAPGEAAPDEAAPHGDASEETALDETAELDETAAPRLVLVPASLAKGLEYDQVIVTEPADIVESEYTEVLGLRRLYVVLTRAVTRLTVLHVRPLPTQLSAL
jgi:hypothetical protein